MQMVQLRGMTWNHERGYAPLLKASEEYNKLRPDVDIIWDKRSLKDFEDYPITELAQEYDLIMLDHPCIGTGVKDRALEPLDDWIPQEYLADQKANSIGGSYCSYNWNGRQWALAVDSASQVCAFRQDHLNQADLPLPTSWDDVFALAASLPSGRKIGIPLHPTHAYSSFISLSANLGGNQFWSESYGIDKEIGDKALSTLRRLYQISHPLSIEMNPIEMLNLMSGTDEVTYCPLIFGYCNYAQAGFAKHVVHFANVPSHRQQPSGALLGGVGLAISAYSQVKREAADFAMYVGSEEVQCGLFFESGGQPGYRKAWQRAENNRAANGFFQDTLRTLDSAYVRPRKPGYITFQEKAGNLIHAWLQTEAPINGFLGELNALYEHSICFGG